ncbi:MAG: DUF1302 family protein [Oceanococcaceae bacterium]
MRRLILLVGSVTLCVPASALQFDVPVLGGLDGVLNTSMTLGAAMRMQRRANDLVGKANLDPSICGVREDGTNFNSCQGINQSDIGPAQALATGLGQFTPNADDGNWNYDQYDLFQAPFKITQDLTLEGDGYGIFSRWLYFYDFVNNDFTEFHPNRLNCTGPNPEDCTPATGPDALGLPVPLTSATYGPGEVVRNKRTNPEALRQAGSDFQLLDLFLYTDIELPWGNDLSLKIGRQSVAWGESTLLVLGSLNSSNPVNANNFFRIGFTPEEVFTPINTLYATTNITDNLAVETYYQLEWQPLEAPTPGTFLSFTDVGTNNVVNFASISFGGPAEDPFGIGAPLNNPLSGLTDSTTTIYKRPDNEARDSGQYGISFKYYAENLNNGTDLGFYFMNYHSKLPFGSFFASDLSCARTHPNNPTGGPQSATGMDANSLPSLLLACPNLPLVDDALNSNLGALGVPEVLDLLGQSVGSITDGLSGLLPLDAINGGLQLIGTGEITDAVPLDTVQFVLDYPEDIRMYGMSFNTAFGDLSLQGEFAYRPNMPVQVDLEDLTFAALGPTLTSCHRSLATDAPAGSLPCGSVLQGLPDPLSQSGPNTFNLIPPTFLNENGNGGDAPSVQRSFPSFISSYRGQTVGENTPNGYIRGFERIQALQFTLGATYILGGTQNPIGADQIILLFEAGANRLLNGPERWDYQIEAPATFRHASAGAFDPNNQAFVDDGSVLTAEQARQARMSAPGCFPGICVGSNASGPTNPYDGGDGLRFNPQQESNSYTTTSAWGYRVIGIVRYESVLPGISIEPFFIVSHDVNGISPGPGENFIEGRKQFYLNVQTRYKSAWSLNTGYSWYTGGGSQNLLRDRDFAAVFVKYQF